MNHKFSSEDVGNIWENNAELWSFLVRSGHDLYRDFVNTPGFFSILPNIKDLKGLDIGCGEGHNTRLLAHQGAKMTAIDISPTFLKYAKDAGDLGINYVEADACSLPFENCSFDFVTSFVALMDIPKFEIALAEAHRVLKENGFFQFSITHPCFWTPELHWIYNSSGEKYALACRDYFNGSEEKIKQWMFEGVPEEISRMKGWFSTPLFKRTLSEWINTLVQIGFSIEYLNEPRPIKEGVQKYPLLAGSDIVPFFLIIRCRKKIDKNTISKQNLKSCT